MSWPDQNQVLDQVQSDKSRDIRLFEHAISMSSIKNSYDEVMH